MAEPSGSGVRTRRPAGVRREEILAVATEAFGNRGFRGVALADIAAAVGISQPGLLHHFPSKEALLIAVLERRDAESFAKMAELAQGRSALDALLDLCRHNAQNPASVRLFAVTSAESIDPPHPAHELFRRRYVAVRESLAERIRHDQAAGLLSLTLDPLQFATEIVAVMDGLQVQWLLDPSLDMCARLGAYLDRYRQPEPTDRGEVEAQ